MFYLLSALTFSGLISSSSLSNKLLLITSFTTSTKQISKDYIIDTNNNIEEIARQITVRIFTQEETGSGVIIANQDETYTVITNAHVVDDNRSHNFQVLTADGAIHESRWKYCNRFSGVDLAFLTFESPKIYQVAELTQKNVSPKDRIYAAGFPGYYYPNNFEIQTTEDWGTKAFTLSKGEIALFSHKSLLQGYQLGYTNDIKEGMSGGPVLNDQGHLVAINGRLKYPIQGISAFTFIDGTLPSQVLFQQMETLSWAIPINRFQKEIQYCLES